MRRPERPGHVPFLVQSLNDHERLDRRIPVRQRVKAHAREYVLDRQSFVAHDSEIIERQRCPSVTWMTGESDH